MDRLDAGFPDAGDSSVNRVRKAPSRTGQRQRPFVILGFVAVLLSACLHNFAGIGAAFLFAILTGEFQRGRLPLQGYAGIFLLLSAYVLFRLVLPSPVSRLEQLQEFARLVGFATAASAMNRMSSEEILKAVLGFMALMVLLYPIFLATGLFSFVDSLGSRRFSAIMPSGNHLGYAAAATSLTLLYLQFSRRYAVAGVWFVHAMLFTIMLGTRSSGALMVLVIGAASIPLSVKPSVKRILISLLGVSVVLALLATPYGQLTIEKLMTFDVQEAMEKAQDHEFGNQGSSFAWRLSYWKAMIDAQLRQGGMYIWLGQGGSATESGQGVFYFMVKDPHSDLVKVFVEYGLIGLFLFFGLLGWQVLRSGAGLAAVAIFFGPMLAGNSLFSPPVLLILVALITVISKRRLESLR